MGSWLPFFTLSVTHEFHGGECPALELVPTGECRQRAKNGEIELRPEKGMAFALCNGDRLDTLPEAANFDFFAYPCAPDFFNYTDAPWGVTGKFLVFDSRRATDAGRLSVGETVSAADLQPETQDLPPPPEPNRQPLCLVRIHAGTGSGHASAPTFTLPFRARRTVWQYYVSGTDADGSGLVVTAADGSEAFDYGGVAALPNGRTASRFDARAAMPLLHDQPAQFSLRERDSRRIVVKKLPVPSWRALARETIGEGEVLTSQMFVNL